MPTKKYVRADLLRPADVILSSESGKGGKSLARLSGGRYSHASLVTGPNLRFESLLDGVGFSQVLIAKCECQEQEVRLLQDISDFGCVEVLRHPDLKTAARNQLAARVRGIVATYLGLQYPNFESLSKAAPDNLLPRWVLQRMLAIADVLRQENIVNPGPFCSMLISLAFEQLGVDLFDDSRPADTVNPNDLCGSRLVPLDNLICTEDPTISNDEEQLARVNKYYGFLARDEILTSLVMGNVVARLLADA